MRARFRRTRNSVSRGFFQTKRRKHKEVCTSISLKEATRCVRECWSVALGNSFNDTERCLLAGYDNGDVKLFDLRTNQVATAARDLILQLPQFIVDPLGDECEKRRLWSSVRSARY